MVTAIHPREAPKRMLDAKLKIPNQPVTRLEVMFCNPNRMPTDWKLRTIAGAGEIDADELKRDQVQGRRTRKNTTRFSGLVS
jgi:hypothetical protein